MTEAADPPIQLALALRRVDGDPDLLEELVRTFQLKDFVAALEFVNLIGKLAEVAGHHPDIDIRYNRVRLALVTHDEGGLTEKDFDLAAQAQNLAP